MLQSNFNSLLYFSLLLMNIPNFMQTFSNQANQREDGSFEALEEGSTVFSGHSVRERETIVSRVFDICLLIEGKYYIFNSSCRYIHTIYILHIMLLFKNHYLYSVSYLYVSITDG